MGEGNPQDNEASRLIREALREGTPISYVLDVDGSLEPDEISVRPAEGKLEIVATTADAFVGVMQQIQASDLYRSQPRAGPRKVNWLVFGLALNVAAVIGAAASENTPFQAIVAVLAVAYVSYTAYRWRSGRKKEKGTDWRG